MDTCGENILGRGVLSRGCGLEELQGGFSGRNRVSEEAAIRDKIRKGGWTEAQRAC